MVQIHSPRPLPHRVFIGLHIRLLRRLPFSEFEIHVFFKRLNFRVARESLSIGSKRRWNFQMPTTGLTTSSGGYSTPLPTCPESYTLWRFSF